MDGENEKSDNAPPSTSLGRDLGDPFLLVGAYLSLSELGRGLRVSKGWAAALAADGEPAVEHLWGAHCVRAWRGKAYVPAALRALARGAAHVRAYEAGAHAEAEASLRRAPVRELKATLRRLGVRARPGELVEKADFVALVLATRRARLFNGQPPPQPPQPPLLRGEGAEEKEESEAEEEEEERRLERLLAVPRLLAWAGEPLPKAALRLSLKDSGRTRVTAEELGELVFTLRLRADGPLAELVPHDPWWAGAGRGEARFRVHDRTVAFTWPRHEDTGVEMNPFALMGLSSEQRLDWELEHGGRAVTLMRHVQEGTLWTSWELPARGVADPLLADVRLKDLPSDLHRDY